MESVASSTWTTLGIESTCPRVLFTHCFLLCIGWVVRPILMFSPTILKITSLLELKILVFPWRISVQNDRSHLPESFFM